MNIFCFLNAHNYGKAFLTRWLNDWPVPVGNIFAQECLRCGHQKQVFDEKTIQDAGWIYYKNR